MTNRSSKALKAEQFIQLCGMIDEHGVVEVMRAILAICDGAALAERKRIAAARKRGNVKRSAKRPS